MNDPPSLASPQKGKTDMLETLLALLLGAAPGAPFSVGVPVDSLVAVVARVGNHWDPDGRSGQPDPNGSEEPTGTGFEADTGNGWDPDG